MPYMSRKNKTPFTILGMLTIRPMTGYDIKKTIQQTTANIWSESLGQIYPALASLVKQGKIVALKTEAKNQRNCKTYKITAKGKRALQEWLAAPAEQQVFRDELLLKLFFGKNMSKAQCIKHIQQRRDDALQGLNYCNAIKRHLETEHASDVDTPFWLLTVSSGICVTTAALKWCDAAIKTLVAEKK